MEICQDRRDYRFVAAAYRTMLPGPLISTTHFTCLSRLKMVRRAASDLNEGQFLMSSATMKWWPLVSLDSRAFMACLEDMSSTLSLRIFGACNVVI